MCGSKGHYQPQAYYSDNATQQTIKKSPHVKRPGDEGAGGTHHLHGLYQEAVAEHGQPYRIIYQEYNHDKQHYGYTAEYDTNLAEVAVHLVYNYVRPRYITYHIALQYELAYAGQAVFIYIFFMQLQGHRCEQRIVTKEVNYVAALYLAFHFHGFFFSDNA